MFWTETDGDVESGFIITPNPPAWHCRSPSSSSEVCAADLSGSGFSVSIGDIEATNGFVDTDVPVTGDDVGVDHAFKRDCDMSAHNTDARFWLFVKLKRGRVSRKTKFRCK